MNNGNNLRPDNTAARVALWRALHVQRDAPPHVFEDEVGLRLLAPNDDWQQRPDMDPLFTRPFRASIIARARFVEDLIVDQAMRGVGQYVLLGAGLDSFAQRRADIACRLTIFEVDQPEPQAWKRRRLIELGFGVPEWLRFVPVNFETDGSWWEQLAANGFDADKRAVVASLGLSLYLTRDAITVMLSRIATLAAGSTFTMTFLLPLQLADPDVRPGLEDGRARSASERNALRQLVYARGDLGARPSGGLPQCRTRIGRGSCSALFCGQAGWPSPAPQCRGTPDRFDVSEGWDRGRVG